MAQPHYTYGSEMCRKGCGRIVSNRSGTCSECAKVNCKRCGKQYTPRGTASATGSVQLNHGAAPASPAGTGIDQIRPSTQQKMTGTQIQWISSLSSCWWLSP